MCVGVYVFLYYITCGDSMVFFDLPVGTYSLVGTISTSPQGETSKSTKLMNINRKETTSQKVRNCHFFQNCSCLRSPSTGKMLNYFDRFC